MSSALVIERETDRKGEKPLAGHPFRRTKELLRLMKKVGKELLKEEEEYARFFEK